MNKWEEKRTRPVLPIYLAALVWPVGALLLPAYRLSNLLIIAGLSLAAYGLGTKFCPTRVICFCTAALSAVDQGYTAARCWRWRSCGYRGRLSAMLLLRSLFTNIPKPPKHNKKPQAGTGPHTRGCRLLPGVFFPY